MSREVQFWVPGIPAPGGSKRYVGHSKAGRAILVDDAGQRNKDWRAVVALCAQQACTSPLLGALALDVEFRLPRPRAHYRSNGDLKDKAPSWHSKRPDATKLLRSTEDACKGILWVDDSQIAEQTVRKRYHTAPGALVTVRELDTQEASV